MINSRSLDELNPNVKALAINMLDECKRQGFRILITSTFRDAAAQGSLYAQGRTKPGNIVTKARPGFSWHNFRCAFDIVPLDALGKPQWNDLKLFAKIGKIGMDAGLEWGGSWTSFKDYPHFQFTDGLSLGQLRAKYGTEAPVSLGEAITLS